MSVFKREIKAGARSAAGWICAVTGMSVLMMMFYPSFERDIADYIKIVDNFPPAMKAALGMQTGNLASAIGFYSFSLLYALLLGSIQAANLGFASMSKEMTLGTADFLLTKPVSRARILTAKLLAALCVIGVTNIVYNLVTVPLVMSFTGGGSLKKVLLLNASLLFLQLIFFALGFAVSAAAKKIKSVLPYSLGLVFMSFALSAFAVTSKDDKLRYLTPFQYFSAESILAKGSYETSFAVLAAVLVCLAVAAAYYFFINKQIRSR